MLLIAGACSAAGATCLMGVQALAGNPVDAFQPQVIVEKPVDAPVYQAPPVPEGCGTQFVASDFTEQPDNSAELIRLQMEETERRRQEEQLARQREEEEIAARRQEQDRSAPVIQQTSSASSVGSSSSRDRSEIERILTRNRNCGTPRGLSQLFDQEDLFCGSPGWTFPGLWGGDCPITVCIAKYGKGDGISGDQDFR